MPDSIYSSAISLPNLGELGRRALSSWSRRQQYDCRRLYDCILQRRRRRRCRDVITIRDVTTDEMRFSTADTHLFTPRIFNSPATVAGNKFSPIFLDIVNDAKLSVEIRAEAGNFSLSQLSSASSLDY